MVQQRRRCRHGGPISAGQLGRKRAHVIARPLLLTPALRVSRAFLRRSIDAVRAPSRIVRPENARRCLPATNTGNMSGCKDPGLRRPQSRATRLTTCSVKQGLLQRLGALVRSFKFVGGALALLIDAASAPYPRSPPPRAQGHRPSGVEVDDDQRAYDRRGLCEEKLRPTRRSGRRAQGLPEATQLMLARAQVRPARRGDAGETAGLNSRPAGRPDAAARQGPGVGQDRDTGSCTRRAAPYLAAAAPATKRAGRGHGPRRQPIMLKACENVDRSAPASS